MIARNYIKHPEALRFQRELFSNGYHNQPRIMRLMECIFDWTPSAPDWWTAAKAKARSLAKAVKKSIADFFKENINGEHQRRSSGTIQNTKPNFNNQAHADKRRHDTTGMRETLRSLAPDVSTSGKRGRRTTSSETHHRASTRGGMVDVGLGGGIGPGHDDIGLDGGFHLVKHAKTMAEFIAEIDGLSVNIWGKLFDAQVRTLDDLADLCVDELTEITGLSEDQAIDLIQKARAHWFSQ